MYYKTAEKGLFFLMHLKCIAKLKENFPIYLKGILISWIFFSLILKILIHNAYHLMHFEYKLNVLDET